MSTGLSCKVCREEEVVLVQAPFETLAHCWLQRAAHAHAYAYACPCDPSGRRASERFVGRRAATLLRCFGESLPPHSYVTIDVEDDAAAYRAGTSGGAPAWRGVGSDRSERDRRTLVAGWQSWTGLGGTPLARRRHVCAPDGGGALHIEFAAVQSLTICSLRRCPWGALHASSTGLVQARGGGYRRNSPSCGIQTGLHVPLLHAGRWLTLRLHLASPPALQAPAVSACPPLQSPRW